MRSVLITGGTGSFGQAFTERLLKNDFAERICIYSRGEHAQANMAAQFRSDSRLRFFIGDVRDRTRLRRAFDGCDVVVHAAALKRIEVGFYNPVEMVKTNVNGAINVVEAAQDAGVEKVIGLSSDKAFQPISPYGQSKALAESVFLAANDISGGDGPRFAVTRYGNVWNSEGSVVPKWRRLLEDGEMRAVVTSLECTRFFMWMYEAVDLVLKGIATMPDEPLVPDLPAYRLGDLVEAMGIDPVIIGLPIYEKRDEWMDSSHCSRDARRLTVDELRAAL